MFTSHNSNNNNNTSRHQRGGITNNLYLHRKASLNNLAIFIFCPKKQCPNIFWEKSHTLDPIQGEAAP